MRRLLNFSLVFYLTMPAGAQAPSAAVTGVPTPAPAKAGVPASPQVKTGAAAAPQRTDPAVSVLVLSPQTIVDLALQRGRSARAAELTAQRSYLGLEQVRAFFDIQLAVTAGYEIDESETVGGLDNLRDRTGTLAARLSKKFQTGTTAALTYNAFQQESLLSAFNQQNSRREPRANSNIVGIELRQALLRNYFGFGDRLQLETAESRIRVALENREEQLEEVLLTAMTQFWNAYVAQQQLRQNLAAREKYEQLVKNVRRKSGFNLATPGELPRLEAEMEAASQRVKSSAAAYLNAVDALLTTIQAGTAGEVIFQVPEEIPPVPQLQAKNVESLRNIRIAQTNLQNAERDLRFAYVAGLPRLDLVAAAKSTGIDSSGSQALAEMTAGTRPTYFIGVELETPLDSSLVRGELADRRVAVEQGRNNLAITRDQTADRLAALERTVAANFSIAQQAVEIVNSRQRVVRELENSYRQGRQPLVELIRSYNDLFDAQLARERAVGNYHISLNELAAARDELVTSKQ